MDIEHKVPSMADWAVTMRQAHLYLTEMNRMSAVGSQKQLALFAGLSLGLRPKPSIIRPETLAKMGNCPRCKQPSCICPPWAGGCGCVR